MALEPVAGKQLKTGISHDVVGNDLEQSVTNSSKGELKVFKDKDGKEVSVYATGKHHEYQFEALLDADAPEKDVGDQLTTGSGTYYVLSWDVIEKNDDAQLVRGTVRDFPDID